MLLEELITKSELEVIEYFCDINNVKKFFKENKNTEFYYPIAIIETSTSNVLSALENNGFQNILSACNYNIKHVRTINNDAVTIVKRLDNDKVLMFQHNLLSQGFSVIFENINRLNLKNTENRIKDIAINIYLEKTKYYYISQYFKKYKKILFINKFFIDIVEKAALVKNFEILHKHRKQLLFRIPEINITNSIGISLNTGSWLININHNPEKCTCNIQVSRESITEFEKDSDYFHSHYNSFPFHAQANLFSFCLGDNPIINKVNDKQLIIDSIYTVKTLVNTIYNFLQWESLEGGPYVTILKTRNNFFYNYVLRRLDMAGLSKFIIKSYFENITYDTNILLDITNDNIYNMILEKFSITYREILSKLLLDSMPKEKLVVGKHVYRIPILTEKDEDTFFKHELLIYNNYDIINESNISTVIFTIIESLLKHVLHNYNVSHVIEHIIMTNVIDHAIVNPNLEDNNELTLIDTGANNENNNNKYGDILISKYRKLKNPNAILRRLI